MSDDDNPDSKAEYFTVGFGRPPRHSRFKKGQSGNPKGRPKGSLNLSTYIERELNQKVIISENGIRKRISKKQVIAKQIVNKAAGGDHKVIPILLNEQRVRANAAAAVPIEEDQIREEDKTVMASLVDRIRKSGGTDSTSSETQQKVDKPIVEESKEGA